MVVAAKTYAEGVSRAAVVRKLVKQVAGEHEALVKITKTATT